MNGPVAKLTFGVLEGASSAALVAEVVELVQSAYRGESSRQGWTTEADILEGQRVDAAMIDDLLARDDSVILTARLAVGSTPWTSDRATGDRAAGESQGDLGGGRDGTEAAAATRTAGQSERLVGCCELRNQPADCSAYLGMFAVSPELQAGGVGRRILTEAERVASTRWGATRMVMTVIGVRHELIAWYERRGYIQTGETGEFPYGDERFGVPLRQDLSFVTLAKDISGTD